MRKIMFGMMGIGLAMAPALAQRNFGESKPAPSAPFTATPVATFDTPWAIALLPGGELLVTEKSGGLYRVTAAGVKTALAGVPAVNFKGQEGLLDVALSPHFAQDQAIYLSYSEPGEGGSGLALARAVLAGDALRDLKVIWRQLPKGGGGQDGGVITFDPEGRHILFASGERMRKTPAQDPDQALGKIIRLNLDGSIPSDNPMAKAGGVRAQTWSTGHRNPYGLAFDARGALWEVEMGPKGGDELNLIRPGRNYGWPEVSYGINYDGSPIPNHDTRPEFEKPALYWTPVIAPGGMAFYRGAMFPRWQGSLLIGGLGSKSLVRVAFDGGKGPYEAERWAMGKRIRDVAVAPDGAVWLVEDEREGRLLRLSRGGK